MKTLDEDSIDWALTTWEGAREESLRRWRELSLAEIIAALEEMQDLADVMRGMAPKNRTDP